MGFIWKIPKAKDPCGKTVNKEGKEEAEDERGRDQICFLLAPSSAMGHHGGED